MKIIKLYSLKNFESSSKQSLMGSRIKNFPLTSLFISSNNLQITFKFLIFLIFFKRKLLLGFDLNVLHQRKSYFLNLSQLFSYHPQCRYGLSLVKRDFSSIQHQKAHSLGVKHYFDSIISGHENPIIFKINEEKIFEDNGFIEIKNRS